MKQQSLNLFVYGTLRKGFHHQAYEYITRYFDFVAEAKVKAVMVDKGDFPAAAPVETENYVVGELYKIRNQSEFDYAFAQLDDYEGLCVEEGEVPLYRREIVIADTGNEKVAAWVYWYNRSVEGYPLIESGDILDFINKKST
jgi:gamma-glutamylcyclotransferase (GGCT)/AIG2-like uncharacterized protein YtfP